MHNKNIIIIGGTDGIGRAIADQLVQNNTILIVGRSKQKGEHFAASNPTNGKYLIADVSVLNNIPTIVSEIRAIFPSLDYIIHTADNLRVKRVNTEEGLEKSIALNYYSRVLLNQLLVGDDATYTPERIIHVAAAGFPSSKSFMKNFPLPEKASSFKGHGLGQLANDFYGLHMREKLAKKGIKINILNPGMVDTNIRRNGQFPTLAKKLLFPLLGLILKTRTPAEYVEVPLAIINGDNDAANQSILINSKGNRIKGSRNVNNAKTQQALYDFTTRQINDLLKSDKVERWL